MIKDILQLFIKRPIPADIGEVYLHWSFPEYVKIDRTRNWYIGAIIVTVALLIYSILTINFLFAVIILLSIFIIILRHYQNPRQIEIKIAETGIVLDGMYFAYPELKSFWFNYNPPEVKLLYLKLRQRDKVFSIPLQNINPLKVRDILNEYIEENLTYQPTETVDLWSKIMRFF